MYQAPWGGGRDAGRGQLPPSPGNSYFHAAVVLKMEDMILWGKRLSKGYSGMAILQNSVLKPSASTYSSLKLICLDAPVLTVTFYKKKAFPSLTSNLTLMRYPQTKLQGHQRKRKLFCK